MFNLQGSELIIILLLALVVLGPEKLPDAMRKLGQFYAELKKMSSGFQEEFRSVIDEPLREMRDTANVLRDSADFTKLQQGERDEKPKSADMAPVDGATVPSDDVPFQVDPIDGVHEPRHEGDPPGTTEAAGDDVPAPPRPFGADQASSAAPRTPPAPSATQPSPAPSTPPEPPPTPPPPSPPPSPAAAPRSAPPFPPPPFSSSRMLSDPVTETDAADANGDGADHIDDHVHDHIDDHVDDHVDDHIDDHVDDRGDEPGDANQNEQGRADDIAGTAAPRDRQT